MLATSGIVRWKLVSKQATCGRSGATSATARIAGEIVRLVQRRERNERVELRKLFRVDARRAFEDRTAMNHAMAGGEQAVAAEELQKPLQGYFKGAGMGVDAARLQPLAIDDAALVLAHGEHRIAGQALDLPAPPRLRKTPAFRLVSREFDAGGSRVKDQDDRR